MTIIQTMLDPNGNYIGLASDLRTLFWWSGVYRVWVELKPEAYGATIEQ